MMQKTRQELPASCNAEVSIRSIDLTLHFSQAYCTKADSSNVQSNSFGFCLVFVNMSELAEAIM